MGHTRNNRAGLGGGVDNQGGTLTITNSTISGNEGSGSPTLAPVGGGISNFSTLILTNSTISGNNADTGGGIFNRGTARLMNTIVADSPSGGDCSGSITSLGYNLDSDGSCGLVGPGDLSGVDPLLAPLADNGGPTFTHALRPRSPAIDAGSPDCPPPATDQRGESRPVDGDGDGTATCDIGAYEAPHIKRGGSRSSHRLDEATREAFRHVKQLAVQGQSFNEVVQIQFSLRTFHRLPIGTVLPESTALTGGRAIIQLTSTNNPNLVAVRLLSLTLEGPTFSFQSDIQAINGTLDLSTGAFHLALSFSHLMTPETPHPFTWEGTANGVYDFASGVVSLTESGQGAFLGE